MCGCSLKQIERRRIPFLAEEGWRASLVEAGAPGAKREPDRAKPQLVVSSAKSEACRSFTEASPYRARASRHPVCAAPASIKLSVASRHLPNGASTPPLRGQQHTWV